MILKYLLNLIPISFFVVIFSNPIYAGDTIDRESPIRWMVQIQNSTKKSVYEHERVNDVIQNGVENKELGIKCTFSFDKTFGSQPDPNQIIRAGKKIKFKKTYMERIFPNCQLKDGLRFSMDGIVCYDYGEDLNIETKHFSFDTAKDGLGIDISCNSGGKHQ